jgi:predicted ATPase
VALEQYCDLLSREPDADWVKWIANRLVADMGQDVCHLVRVFPKLGVLFNESTLQNAAVIDNYRNAIERVQFLLCRFIDVIASNSKVLLSLLIDDVQWADQATITVLSRLALQKQKKFFLICCYRDDEFSHGHPFCEILNAMHNDVLRVKLNNCEEDVRYQ